MSPTAAETTTENPNALRWSDAVDAIAYLDMFDRFDSWFGHWWNVPFWKAENPLVAFLKNLTWQGHKRFAISRMGEFSGYEVELFLRNHGVYVWGRWFDPENLYFNVKKEQAAWAEYLLAREGVTTMNTPVDTRNAEWAARHDGAPPGWGSNKRTVGDAMIGLLRPDLSFRYSPRSRTRPTGPRKAVRRNARKAGAKASRHRSGRKQKQTAVQQLTKAAGVRVQQRTRRPARPHRPGQSRRK